MDWTLADEVLKKTPLDLQERFPINPSNSKYLAVHFCGSAFPENGSASRQDHDKVGVTLVNWQRGMVHCVLIQHLFKISRITHTINFIL